MNVGESFAKVLKAQRLQAGLTQEELAEKSHVSTRYVSLLECNRQQPTLGYVFALAHAMGMSVSDLIKAVEKNMTSSNGQNAPCIRYLLIPVDCDDEKKN